MLPISVCGGTFHTATGVMTSPRYPSPYPERKICEYLIVARQGQQILLNVTDFSVEGAPDCLHADYLEIRYIEGD